MNRTMYVESQMQQIFRNIEKELGNEGSKDTYGVTNDCGGSHERKDSDLRLAPI